MSAILIGILACEIGFWALLGLGLIARYLLRLRRASSVLLLLVPVLDLLLLALISWDLLANGTTADFSHGLGAIYLGFTVAFGHQIITRVDAWFAHRVAGGPPPARLPRNGVRRVRHEWSQWLRMVICAVIASAVLGAMVVLVGDPSRTAELTEWFARIWLVTAIWLIGWPVWVSVSHMFRRQSASSS